MIDVSTVTEFAKQFPPQLCKTKVASQPNQPTIFILSCPAFWGSNQALQFGFVEPEGQKHDLVLMAVKLNGPTCETYVSPAPGVPSKQVEHLSDGTVRLAATPATSSPSVGVSIDPKGVLHITPTTAPAGGGKTTQPGVIPTTEPGHLTPTLRGEPPAAYGRLTGCSFAGRCPLVRERCREEAPPLEQAGPGRRSACHFWEEALASSAAPSSEPSGR